MTLSQRLTAGHGGHDCDLLPVVLEHSRNDVAALAGLGLEVVNGLLEDLDTTARDEDLGTVGDVGVGKS